jgi:MFS transporter, DHA1 family, multidrug resistance protein
VRTRVFTGLPREVAVLTAVAFAVAVGFGVVAPAIPVFARAFGVGETAAGAVISAFAFARLVFALSSGKLVDRFGERVILATGIGIVAVSSFLAGLSQSYVQLLLLRGIGGVGSAMFTVSAVSLLLRVVSSEHRGRATGLWQSGFLLGAIAGPAIGGPLTAISLRAPFFVYAGTLAVAGTIGMVFLSKAELHEKPTGEESAAAPRTSLREAFHVSGYRAALTANLGTGWALFGVRSSLIPLFVVEGLGRSSTWTGVGFFVSAAAQGLLLLPVGRFVDTTGRRPAMIFGAGVASLSMVLITVESLVVFVLAMTLFGVGAAFLSVAPSAAVGDVFSGRGGTVVAVFQMSADLGAVAGPLIAGWLAEQYSFDAAFIATAGVLALGLVMAVASRETRHRADPEQPPVAAPAT